MPDIGPRGDTRGRARDVAIRHFWRDDPLDRDPCLFALLDCARDRAIYPELRRLAGRGAEVLPLYQGQALTELASVAPYLVGFGAGLDVFDWFWSEGWGASWGILLWSPVTPATLRDHFRRHTKVRSDDGQVLLSRFYDPRVLRMLLPVLDARQVVDFWGPVTRFHAESEDGAEIIDFSHSGGILKLAGISLAGNDQGSGSSVGPAAGSITSR